MIIIPRDPTPANKPLKSNTRTLHLVENSLLRSIIAIEEEIVKERRDGIVGDVGGRKLLAGVLGAAVGETHVAVGGGEDGGVRLRVHAHGEGEGDFAVAVVFVVARGISEVAGGRVGEDEVGGAGAGGAGGGGCGAGG